MAKVLTNQTGKSSSSYTHGMSGTPEYIAWQQAKDRIFNSNSNRFEDYGGRGLTMDKKYYIGIKAFSNFFKEIGPKPSPSHSLDRKNNNNGYVEGNMKWSNHVQQNINRRNNIMLTYKLQTKCLQEWAAELKIYPSSISMWLKKNKSFSWIYERFSKNDKSKSTNRWLIFKGTKLTLLEWAKVLEVTPSTITYHLNKGKSFDWIHIRFMQRKHA